MRLDEQPVRMVPKISKHKSKKPSMKSRKKFSKEVKQKAYEMFNGMCGSCGWREVVDPHHIRFKSDEGKGVLTNCLPVCRECHIEIHKYPSIALKWREWAREKYGPLYWADEWDKKWL